MRRTALVVIAILFIATSSRGVFALTAAQQQTLDTDSEYFDNTQSSQCGGNYSTTPSTTVGATTWTASVQPPYYLESYIINILEDLAQAEDISESSTVTQEHVDALVAWAYLEGGNIANNSYFNLWNGGFLGPSYSSLYVGGTGNSNGTQTAFASFDDGVEGSTDLITGSYQSRIGAILSQSGSTAEQVLNTIAHYSNTPGNLAWSWGSDPSDPAAVLANQATYANSLLAMLATTRQNYAQEATVIIGPGQEGQGHVPVSDLVYSGGASNSSPTSSAGCTSASSVNCTTNGNTAVGTEAILCEAEKYAGIYYAWGGGHDGYAAFRAACPEDSIAGAAAVSTADNPGPCATDCSGLVSVAVDAAFNQTFDWTVSESDGTMGNGSPSSDWQSIPISQALPGDLVTFYTGGDGHVEIVVSVSGGSVTSFGSHETGTQTGEDTQPFSFWNGGAWRYIGPGVN